MTNHDENTSIEAQIGRLQYRTRDTRDAVDILIR